MSNKRFVNFALSASIGLSLAGCLEISQQLRENLNSFITPPHYTNAI